MTESATCQTPSPARATPAAAAASSAARARLCWGAALLFAVVSIPGILSLPNFFAIDTGAAYAATLMSLHGARPNVDFGYPYGPLTLSLQQLFVWISGRRPLGFELLLFLVALTAGAIAARAVRRLQLALAPALLLALVVGLIALPNAPVYPLEEMALLAVLVTLAEGRRGLALAWCVVAALLKPAMGYVLGAVILAEALWAWGRQPATERRLRSLLLPPALTAVALSAALIADFGPQAFVGMALPLVGARHYRQMGFSFFHRAGNPFGYPLSGHIHLYLGSGSAAWGVACLALLALLLWRRPSGDRPRWLAAVFSLVATAIFIAAFYGPLGQFHIYMILPLIGLAMLPWQGRAPGFARWLTVALVAISFAPTLYNIGLLALQGRPSAGTAGLWALSEESAEWARFQAANPPATHPLLLIGGSPEALFPAYGPPWHTYLMRGETTPREVDEMLRRAYAAQCIAINIRWQAYAPPELTAVLYNLHRPVQQGLFFDSFGCAPF